ncbi:MAG: hypothetical protein ACJ8IK_20430 [Burkholderiaceae bacterium]|jgi:hypothetical protein
MLDEQVTTAVAIGNLKAISEQPAMLSNLAYSNVVSTNNLGQQNAVANQRAVGELAIPLVAKGVNTISDLGPLAARAAVDVLTNDEVAQAIADLEASVEAFAGPRGQGGKPHHGGWKRLRALIELGLRLDEHGHLVVPANMTIVVNGRFAKEDIQINVDNHRVTIKVTQLAR